MVIGVAVVGCGYWGPNVIRNFNALDGCEVRWLCDVDPDVMAGVQRHYPAARATTDFDALLEQPDVDAVAICTPVRTHYPLSRASLSAG